MEFEYYFGVAGSHTARVVTPDSAVGPIAFTVIEGAPFFKVRYFVVRALPLGIGERAKLGISIGNEGMQRGTRVVWLEVDGVRVEEKVLTLNPEEVVTLAFDYELSFAQDGVYTVRVGTGDETAVLAVPVESAEVVRTLSGPDVVFSVAFSPDGKTLASGSRDKTIKLWDVATGSVLRTLSGHTGRVNSVAFSPDGKILASGSADSTIKLWDAATGGELRTLSGHTRSVLSVAFSPDGRLLASGSEDKTIKLWNVGRYTYR